VQAINYPTVARGKERLIFTITPSHTLEQLDPPPTPSMTLSLLSPSNAKQTGPPLEGGCGVGSDVRQTIKLIWNDDQIGLTGSAVLAPRTGRAGEPHREDANALVVARRQFDRLLGPIVTRNAFASAAATQAPDISGLRRRMGAAIRRPLEVPMAVPFAATA
jgi:5-aminolevulinate synthase